MIIIFHLFGLGSEAKLLNFSIFVQNINWKSISNDFKAFFWHFLIHLYFIFSAELAQASEASELLASLANRLPPESPLLQQIEAVAKEQQYNLMQQQQQTSVYSANQSYTQQQRLLQQQQQQQQQAQQQQVCLQKIKFKFPAKSFFFSQM